MPLPPYLIGGVQLLQVSESWVSSAKRGIRGAGGAAEVAGGFLSVIECQICLALKRDCLMQASTFVNVFSITRER